MQGTALPSLTVPEPFALPGERIHREAQAQRVRELAEQAERERQAAEFKVSWEWDPAGWGSATMARQKEGASPWAGCKTLSAPGRRQAQAAQLQVQGGQQLWARRHRFAVQGGVRQVQHSGRLQAFQCRIQGWAMEHMEAAGTSRHEGAAAGCEQTAVQSLQLGGLGLPNLA